MCFSHYISARDLEELILEDIRAKARDIAVDEQDIKDEFIKRNAELTDSTVKSAKKELKGKQRRLEELTRLMQVAYEDRVKGKMPEDICVEFIEKYSAEKKAVADEIAMLEEKILQVENTVQNVDAFIRNIKKYLEVPELTREMCYELIDRVIIGSAPQNAEQGRMIEIVYKADISSVLKYKIKNQ
jgi:hypothetical protein